MTLLYLLQTKRQDSYRCSNYKFLHQKFLDCPNCKEPVLAFKNTSKITRNQNYAKYKKDN